MAAMSIGTPEAKKRVALVTGGMGGLGEAIGVTRSLLEHAEIPVFMLH